MLADIFNIIWTEGEIPKVFKHAIIIPIQKPDKDSSDAASYRPISLTSHIGKILETIVTKRLNFYLEQNNIINKNQSGFRRARQTMDQIAQLVHEAEKAKRQNKILSAVMLDLEKAYDTLWREGTLDEIDKIGIGGNMYNYILNFLKDRTFQVRVGKELSDVHTQTNGVPQGAVISPTLFNIMINEIGKLEEKIEKVNIGQFADDVCIYQKADSAYSTKSKVKVEEATKKPVEKVIEKLEEKGFKTNIKKTQWIIFNRTKKKHDIKIKGQNVKAKTEAKYLGVTLDSKLTYTKHIKNLVSKGQAAVNILRNINGKNWGLKRQTRMLLYKNFIRSKISYGEEVYDAGSASALKELDTIQNKALKIVTSVPSSAPTLPLYTLTGVEPLEDRRALAKVKLWNRVEYNNSNPAIKIYNEQLKKVPLKNKKNNNKTNTKNITINEDTNRIKKLIGVDDKEIIKLPKPLPTWQLHGVDTDTSLIHSINKKKDKTQSMFSIASDYLKENYDSHTKIFTDGSKEEEKVGAGYICTKDDTPYSAKITNDTSIMTAELIAIDEAINHAIKEHKSEKVLIATDSLSSIQAINKEENKARPDLVNNIITKYNHALEDNTKITVIWIPSHVGIQGNEEADELANKGKNSKKTKNIKLGLQERKS